MSLTQREEGLRTPTCDTCRIKICTIDCLLTSTWSLQDPTEAVELKRVEQDNGNDCHNCMEYLAGTIHPTTRRM